MIKIKKIITLWLIITIFTISGCTPLSASVNSPQNASNSEMTHYTILPTDLVTEAPVAPESLSVATTVPDVSYTPMNETLYPVTSLTPTNNTVVITPPVCTNTPAPTETPSATSTPTETSVPTCTPTSIPTNTPKPTTSPKPTPTPTPAIMPTPAPVLPNYTVTAFDTEVFTLLNQMRALHGLSTLQINSTYCCVACVRAREASTVWSHTRPDGRRCFTVFDDYDVTPGNHKGEILGRGNNLTASALVNAWMNSESHREEILKPDFAIAGIASYEGMDERVYVAVLFSDLH